MSGEIDPASHITIPPKVLAREVGDESVILSVESGSYFGLDAVGTRMWQLIGAGNTVRAICESMLQEFDTTPEQLTLDVSALLRQLAANQLVLIEPSSPEAR